MLDWWYELKEWWIDDVPRGFKDWLAFVGKGMGIVFFILFILYRQLFPFFLRNFIKFSYTCRTAT